MTFLKKIWRDEQSGGTPINSQDLNRIEQGIADNADAWDSICRAPTLLATLPQSTSERIAAAAGIEGYRTLHIEAHGHGHVECLDIPAVLFTADTVKTWQVPRINGDFNAYVRYAGAGKIAYLTGVLILDGIKVYGLS